MLEVSNIDSRIVESFGDEWSHFDQSGLPETERKEIFDQYFAIFPWTKLPSHAEGFDMGCGSGRFSEVRHSVKPIGSTFALMTPTARLL